MEQAINKTDGSGAMFDRIARRYDLLNGVMSMGLDRFWRAQLVRSLALGEHAQVLDVATGTADVAIAICKKHVTASVVGVDPSVEMLNVGHHKIERTRMASHITLLQGDAQSLPFRSGQFDAACISFGIRNVPDRMLAVREMARVVKPGGRVVVLELTEPRDGLLAPLARLHVHHIVPRLGAWLSNAEEYAYLQRSIAAFPPPREFLAALEQAGLREVRMQRMALGSVHLFVGQVPVAGT